MALLGFVSVFFVGVMLAIVGGGGSILMVPILFYLFELPADVATSYSLFLVGLSAAIGAHQYHRRNEVHFKVGLTFAIPGFMGVFLVRKYLMPRIPNLFEVFDYTVTKDQIILLVFAFLMLLASMSMIADRSQAAGAGRMTLKYKAPLITVEGFLVGAVTGFVGAGGGFLIIPALVLLADLPMKQAVGTSLMIIAAKSLIGVTGDLGVIEVDLGFLGVLSAFSVFGIGVGSYFARFIKPEHLKPVFGYFTLIMGSVMMAQQLFY